MIRSSDVAELPWQRVYVLWITVLALIVYTICTLVGLTASVFLNVSVAMWTSIPLFLYSFILLFAIGEKKWFAGIVLLPVLLAIVWQLASIEMYSEQMRFLTWQEISLLLSNDGTRSIVFEYLWSVPVFVLSILFYVFYFLGVTYADQLLRRIPYYLPLSVLVCVILFGGIWSGIYGHYQNKFKEQRLSAMTWSSLSLSSSDNPVASEAVAGTQWHAVHDDIFVERQLTQMQALGGLCPKRNIIVVILESHALAHIDQIGADYQQHQASSPFLGELAKQCIQFSNYFVTAFSTQSASWSILSGFPYYYEAEFTPRLMLLGPAKDFIDAGYALQWLQGTDIEFAHFKGMLETLKASWGPSEVEKQQLKKKDARLWSPWGMPDEQLYEVAFENYNTHLKESSEPILQLILTVSNHGPYNLPPHIEGHTLSRDHFGGMRYADFALKHFLEKVRSLPIDQQPLIWITADTAFRNKGDNEHGLDAEPLSSMRIPSLLVLPADVSIKEPIQSINEMLCHEDLLPILAKIVGVETRFDQRLSQFQRRHILIYNEEGSIVLSSEHYLYAGDAFYRILNRWKVEAAEARGDQYDTLRRIHDYSHTLRRSIWFYGDRDVIR